MKKRIVSLIKLYMLIFTAGLLYALLFSKFNIKIPCIFYTITGLLCPSCGISRMCIEILKGEFLTAFYYNRLIFCLIPVFFAIFLKWNIDYIRFGKIKYGKMENALIIVMIVLLVLFGMIRNIL